jgi:hypothetical protein
MEIKEEFSVKPKKIWLTIIFCCTKQWKVRKLCINHLTAKQKEFLSILSRVLHGCLLVSMHAKLFACV